jgi:phosphate/phosphite/phosphonate ABC transporter binding protein
VGPTELSPTPLVGRYLLLERLAIGGMAEVFLACDHARQDQLIVIKRILPYLAQHEEFVDAFEREARMASGISHPNVVRIFASSAEHGVPFIAMEYVAGSTLRELLSAACSAERKLPVEVALDLLRQACAGAHAAHELKDEHGRPFGLVHRDITPHNLIVTDRGQVKLLDFGIAKASEGMDHTQTGLLKGKIAYMSPEQCRQDRVDRRSDIFSLGVLGYQLLTGVKPFQGKSELATMQAIITGRHEPLEKVRPEVPAPVAQAIEQAMRPDPAQRFPTAEALCRALGGGSCSGEAESLPITAVFVQELLGAAHEARRRSIDQAMGGRQAMGGAAGRASAPPSMASEEPASEQPIMTESIDRSEHAALSRNLARSTTRPLTAPQVRSRLLLATLLALLLLLAALAAATLAVMAADSAPRPPSSAAPLLGGPVIMALAPTSSSEDLLEDLEPLRLHLQRSTGRSVRFEVGSSYRDAAGQLLGGEAHFALLPPHTAARALQADPSAEILAVEVVDGSTSSDGYLLVRREDPVQEVSDLVGRTVCWTDEWSATGFALPRRYLSSQGLDPDRDLVSHFSGNHTQVLLDLLQGTCDAGATFSLHYQTADQRGLATARLRILAITGTSLHDAVVASSAADPSTVELVREALLSFQPEPEAPGAGSQARLSGFAPPPPELTSP